MSCCSGLQNYFRLGRRLRNFQIVGVLLGRDVLSGDNDDFVVSHGRSFHGLQTFYFLLKCPLERIRSGKLLLDLLHVLLLQILEVLLGSFVLHARLNKLQRGLLEHFFLLIQLHLSAASCLVGALQMRLLLLLGSLSYFLHLDVEFRNALGLRHLDEAWL